MMEKKSNCAKIRLSNLHKEVTPIFIEIVSQKWVGRKTKDIDG